MIEVVAPSKLHAILLRLFFAALAYLMFFAPRMGESAYLLSLGALAVFGMRLHKAMTASP